MNINNLTYKNNLSYKNNLTYKDNLNCNNSNSILNSKSLILNYPINPPVSKADIPHYKGWRGVYCKSSILNFSKSAFSLIELSIVLIIIRLLIAGVTGGASLIQSAKVRSMINELKGYERAVYTFQAAKGRYPGDVKNYGTFGYYSNYYSSSDAAKPYYVYQATDFPSDFITEFRKTAGTNVIPNYNSAPFVELYNEGIIDFKPLGNDSAASKNYPKKGTPSLKVEPNTRGYFLHTGTHLDYIAKPCTKGAENCLSYKGLNYSGRIKETLHFIFDKGFNPKILKAVDEKMDDGWYSSGMFRTGCYGSYGSGYNSYENAIRGGKKCGWIDYVL